MENNIGKSYKLGSLELNNNISSCSCTKEEIIASSIKSNSNLNKEIIENINEEIETINEDSKDQPLQKQLDGADNDDRSINSAAIDDNCSTVSSIKEHVCTTKGKKAIIYSDDYVETNPPAVHSVMVRVIVSWIFGLVNMVIMMVFNPKYPMHFIWGILVVGCFQTALFAVSWAAALLHFKLTFLIIFSTGVYWIAAPICWHILYITDNYPPPIGIFTAIFPFEAMVLIFLTLLLPRRIRSQKANKKKIAAAYSSLAAPYFSFVSGLVYYNLYHLSNNTGRLLLPPVYTIMMKTLQLALDLICVRCAHTASNLFLFVSRIIASYYSFAVLSFIKTPMALISVILSKIGLHIFLSLFMVFPSIEKNIISWLPERLIVWKMRFEKGVQDMDENTVLISNEYDRMAVENDPAFTRLHVSATNLSFSMICDLMSILMIYSFYTFGRFGPANSHYNGLFPFGQPEDPDSQYHFNIFFIFLAICLVTLTVGYIVITAVLNYIIKDLDLKRVLQLLSVNWYPMKNFYVMCVNFMMSYVIIIVAQMPDLFYLPTISFWSKDVVNHSQ